MFPLSENWTLCSCLSTAQQSFSAVGKRGCASGVTSEESGRPTVSLIVSGIKLTVLVDRRASVSLLRRNVLDQIIKKTHRVHVLEKSGPLQGLGSMSLKVCGKTQISVAGIRSSRSCRLRHIAP